MEGGPEKGFARGGVSAHTHTHTHTHTHLHGALNSAFFAFLATMPPSTVSGKVTSAQVRMMMTMVPNGSAAVD